MVLDRDLLLTAHGNIRSHPPFDSRGNLTPAPGGAAKYWTGSQRNGWTRSCDTRKFSVPIPFRQRKYTRREASSDPLTIIPPRDRVVLKTISSMRMILEVIYEEPSFSHRFRTGVSHGTLLYSIRTNFSRGTIMYVGR